MLSQEASLKEATSLCLPLANSAHQRKCCYQEAVLDFVLLFLKFLLKLLSGFMWKFLPHVEGKNCLFILVWICSIMWVLRDQTQVVDGQTLVAKPSPRPLKFHF